MFRKNVASQFIHFQGVDATTGGIKSGVSWTVRRCIDGTFAAGGGTVTEDSTNGWYKYAMSQADTNGNNIAFNFTGTGAVPQTVNIVTTAADPTDATAFGITRLDATVSSRLASASYTAPLDAAGTRTAVGLASANLDTQLSALSNLDAAVTTRLAAASYKSPTSAMTESYSALHAAPTLEQAMFQIIAMLNEKSVGGTTLTANKIDGTTPAMTFTLNDASTPTAITRAS